MSPKEKSGMKFEPSNSAFSKTESTINNELTQITRKSYRIALRKWNTLEVKLNNRTFDVINISVKGLGIRIESPEIFQIGHELPDIKLNLEGKKFTMQGKVNHISPHEHGGFLCGIAVKHLDKDSEGAITAFVQQNRNELFE
ncbi:MAG: PilZ domain-containing protein [Deltaproteobacteria bacterium]|nr:PilZ domain-containing protein [Deltaproteobacteria bacterium]